MLVFVVFVLEAMPIGNLFPKLSQHELKLFADYFSAKMMHG